MNTILLSNLIKIRWIAIVGQFFAILIVYYLLKINILLFESLFVVFFSVAVNLFSYFLQKKNNQISDKQVFLFLLYDTFQLGLLLYLTGGIFNPFCILIIAPVIISASYLPVLWTVILSFFSIIVIIFVNFVYISIDWQGAFLIPNLYKLGLLLALIIAIIFIAVYVNLFASSSRKISEALSETKLQLLNQKKITEVGSLSAAAVHELSTPLNTIFLILNDFLKNKILIKNSDVLKDIELIKSQAERCKNILFRLSKNPLNLKDTFLRKTKISDLIKITFEKFNSNKSLRVFCLNNQEEPEIIIKDEIVYALGNLIQNAIIYSVKLVTVKIDFDKAHINLQIIDDGSGFTKDILDKIGEPYISRNNKGMGLGIFIAKNLVENLGGKILFYNLNENNAIVEIKLNRSVL